MARHNATGRSRTGPLFMQLHFWMLDSPAWRSLGVYSRCLYLEMRRRYNGYNNGDIPMSHREARGLVGCSNKPITAAFRQLEETGFIHPTQKGSFDWKLSASGMSRSTRWTLAELPVNCPRETLTASKDFMKWRPVESAKKNHGVPTAYVTGALGTP